MKHVVTLGWIALAATLHAQSIHLHGRVSNVAGQPVADASVELVKQGIRDATGPDGLYSITKLSASMQPKSSTHTEHIRLDKGVLEFTVSRTSAVKIEVHDLNGSTLDRKSLSDAQPGVHRFDLASRTMANRMLIVQASIGPFVRTFRYIPSQTDVAERGSSNGSIPSAGRELASLATESDTLKVSAIGHATKKIAIASYDTTVDVILEADPNVGVPKVTPQKATSVPAMYGNAVANPGKMTTNVSYPAYYYSTSLSSPLPPPKVAKQSVPKTKLCNVYTPPGYDPQKQYPMIVIMHGITDNPNTWIERSNPKIATLFDNLITSKATKPFIAVFASGTVDNNTNGYYAFGAELVNDLLPFIESKYSVRKDRGSRAMAGFSFGGMQTLSVGLCTHLKEFAWFAGLHAAGPGTPSASDIAKYVAAQDPQTYPLHYLYIGVGASDGTASGSSSNAANGLTSKGPNITSANFSFQNNIPGYHDYPTAEVSLYNFLRMAFSPEY